MLLDWIGRTSLSALILIGIIGLGTAFNPVVRTGQATVTDRIGILRSGPPKIPEGTWDQPRGFRLNQGRVWVRRGRIDKEKASGLWFWIERTVREIIFGGREAGFLAGLRLERNRALKLLQKGINPADLVSAFLVLKDDKTSNSDAFAFSASGLSLKNFLPEGRGDTPGEDPAGIPRLPLSRRIIFIQSSTSSPQLQIAAYRYPGSPAQARIFYSHRLAREGWEDLGSAAGERTFSFRKQKELLSIGIHEDPEDGVFITVALLRR